MCVLRVLCWALIFVFRLRFPPGSSIATSILLCQRPNKSIKCLSKLNQMSKQAGHKMFSCSCSCRYYFLLFDRLRRLIVCLFHVWQPHCVLCTCCVTLYIRMFNILRTELQEIVQCSEPQKWIRSSVT